VRLADTCVWIELLQGTPTGEHYRRYFDDPDQVLVPTLVQYELCRWVLRERGEEVANRVIAATRNSRIVPLNEATALRAAALALQFRLTAADALIYATALHQQVPLVTCDAHFDSLPGVEYRAKLAA
jgi:predicted nucleic acid-binding protein